MCFGVVRQEFDDVVGQLSKTKVYALLQRTYPDVDAAIIREIEDGFIVGAPSRLRSRYHRTSPGVRCDSGRASCPPESFSAYHAVTASPLALGHRSTPLR